MKRLLILFALLSTLGVARAAPDATPKAADSEGFVKVEEGESLGVGEVIPGNRMVAAAYGFILASLVVWVASVAVRARRAEEEMAALRAKIEKA